MAENIDDDLIASEDPVVPFTEDDYLTSEPTDEVGDDAEPETIGEAEDQS